MEFRTLSPSDKARAAANAIEFGLDGHTFDMAHYCGTARCVAGHIVALSGITDIPFDGSGAIAQEILGISEKDRYLMFVPHKWHRHNFNWKDGSITASHAAAMLRHWADTRDATGHGEIDWAGTKPEASS